MRNIIPITAVGAFCSFPKNVVAMPTIAIPTMRRSRPVIWCLAYLLFKKRTLIPDANMIISPPLIICITLGAVNAAA